jgi:hypothetical protein
MGGAPATTTFRGITVDPTTADALTELARIVGDDIYLSPIPGCGSYQTSTKASAGTHAGGGAADVNAENLTDEQARRIETRARSIGFVAYFRPRISPYSGNPYGWQRHVHMIRRDCTDLSPEAKAQITAYDQGTDALAVPHKDTGSRAYVGMTWAKYRAAQSEPTKPVPIPAGDDMPITDADAQKIANAVASLAIPNHDPNPGDKTPPATYAAKSYWVMGNWRAADLQNTVAKLRAELAGLSAAVEALAKAQGADASQIAGIVDQAVRDRLAQVRFDVTDSPNA